jgi:hypothetical protein
MSNLSTAFDSRSLRKAQEYLIGAGIVYTDAKRVMLDASMSALAAQLCLDHCKQQVEDLYESPKSERHAMRDKRYNDAMDAMGKAILEEGIAESRYTLCLESSEIAHENLEDAECSVYEMTTATH